MRTRGALALPLLLCGLAACDGGYTQFLDAVPAGDDGAPAEVQVFVGIDGLSRQAFDAARARGAFRTYDVADLITPFPGTSDYVWTRLLHGAPMQGYELGYYDPAANGVVHDGLTGVAEHAFREGIYESLPCYRRFDFLGDGDLWMPRTYEDPEGSLNGTLDALFSVVEARGRRRAELLVYLLNVDVLSHQGGLAAVTAALVEVDRRIREFQDRHPGRFRFTLFGDHGSTLRKTELIDPRDLLTAQGILPVEALERPDRLEALPLVHVRVNYVSVHTHQALVPEVARRLSRERAVDVAVAPLGPADTAGARRYGVWQAGELHAFTRAADGSILVEAPLGWRALGIDLAGFVAPGDTRARLGDAEAFAATAGGPRPDLFHRVATAFTHPAAHYPADLILSLTDDTASYGLHIPGSGDDAFVDGFHGSLSRASTLSVLATELGPLPAAVRADDLPALLPGFARRLAR
jgi:hypothetical protein